MNTVSFSLLNAANQGLPEGLLWGFTYFFQAGQDYVNFIRKSGRIPRWYTDPKEGDTRLTTNVQQTYGRLFFFTGTWTIVAGCNLAVVLPIMAVQGPESVGPWLGRVVINATLGVFSFAFIDAFFSRLRDYQFKLQKEAADLEKHLEVRAGELNDAELAALRARIEQLEKSAKRYDRLYKWPRTAYYGGVYPFFKHDHLWGNQWKQYILVGMGLVGFVIDVAENAIRLNWLSLGTASQGNLTEEEVSEAPTTVSAATPLSKQHSCATHLIAVTTGQVAAFRQTLK